MRRERYRGHIVVARLLKVRARSVWHASVYLDQLVNGTWMELPIEPGLSGQEFTSESSALTAALELGRRHVDCLHDMHRLNGPSFETNAKSDSGPVGTSGW